MSTLTREQILAAKDLKTKEILVKQWGGTVRVRQLTVRERDQMAIEMQVQGDSPERLRAIREKNCQLCLVDDDGKQLFSPDDIDGLGGKSPDVIDMLFDEITELSKVTERDVKEMEGNSEGGRTSSSATG